MIILLTGKIGSGKSTACEFLKKKGFIELSFAEPIKQLALQLGFTQDQCYGTQKQKLEINQKWGFSARKFFQIVGNLGRTFLTEKLELEKTLWLKNVERQLCDFENIVISDGRFLDEVEMIKNHKGIVVKLERKIEDCSTSHCNQDISESYIDKIISDFLIINNGDLETLYHDLEIILEASNNILYKQ